MRKKVCLGVDMQELDDILVSHNSSTTSGWECLGGDNLPVVVGVIMTITSHLLT